jgi:muconolactone delta-isomerase
MPTRYDNSGTCHAFAHADVGESGQSHNGNLFFQGNVLYSYSARYPVAVIIDRENRIALFNADPSSVTTEAKHKNPARRALGHFTLHMIPDLDVIARQFRNGKLIMTSVDLVSYVTARAKDVESLIEKSTRLRAEWKKSQNANEQEMHENAARIVWAMAGRRGDCFKVAAKETSAALKARQTRQLESGLASVQRAAQVDVRETVAKIDHMTASCANADSGDMGIFYHEIEKLTFVFPDVIPSGMGEKRARAIMGKEWLAGALRTQEATKKRNEPIHQALVRYSRAHAARHAELNAAKVADWLAGARVSLPHSVPMTLRIIEEELQTSQGARVPLEEAIALARFAAARRIAGKPWRRNGERRRVGAFECDAITERGDIVAGCHRIPWSAIVDCVARYRAMLPDTLKNAVLDSE